MKCWIESAGQSGCDFPIENLPYGVFRKGSGNRIGVAIGDQILDLRACAEGGLLPPVPAEVIEACRAEVLNPLMALGATAWSGLRRRLTALLTIEEQRREVEGMLVPLADVEMQVPADIGDYTDFYASIDHATRVGKLFRPDNPLLPNYKHLPIGYHGRASSIVASGTPIRRPSGQTKPAEAAGPTFGATRCLDYELEVGLFVGPGNRLGEPIAIEEAEAHIFGLCLLNDWSARDMQAWEYQPLGPFLAKSFGTTVSPWVVTLEALAPYRVARTPHADGDPEPLEYLASRPGSRDGIDVTLEVYLESAQMREAGMEPVRVSRGNLRNLYWSMAQLLTHHASNGCNLRPGDLVGTGTISGPDEGSEGCLLEMKHRAEPLRMPTGETRTFLEDGDRVVFKAYAEREGLPRIGFGECSGMITGGS